MQALHETQKVEKMLAVSSRSLNKRNSRFEWHWEFSWLKSRQKMFLLFQCALWKAFHSHDKHMETKARKTHVCSTKHAIKFTRKIVVSSIQRVAISTRLVSLAQYDSKANPCNWSLSLYLKKMKHLIPSDLTFTSHNSWLIHLHHFTWIINHASTTNSLLLNDRKCLVIWMGSTEQVEKRWNEKISQTIAFSKVF